MTLHLARIVSSSFVVAAALAAAACHHGRPRTPAGMTLAAAPAPAPLATLVWVGRGAAERYADGRWHRAPAFDYEFSVEQRRYADHWDSVKTMRRYHPDYDGSAGPRLQVYLFHLALAPGAAGEVAYRVGSTLGAGHGRGDGEFREAVLEIDADVSMFAPFDRYRITQRYQYEDGRLTEDVELNDGAAPWVRNHEEAVLFGPSRFAQPPTTLTARAP
ncbi:MAG: hypothetical protein IPL61_35925 [Myxococcales bacterium]|nr:hypothetical protein [Myxococcales bacterium]